MKEGTGSDNLVVGWLKPGQTGTTPSQVIPGSALSPRQNPAKDNITILVSEKMLNKNATISIIAMNGRVISQTKKILNSTEKLYLTNVASGLFIIRIDKKDGIVNRKISVMK